MIDTNSMLKIIDEHISNMQKRIDIKKVQKGNVSTLLFNVFGELYYLIDVEEDEKYYVFWFIGIIRNKRGIAPQKFVKYRKISNCIIKHSFLIPISYLKTLIPTEFHTHIPFNSLSSNTPITDLCIPEYPTFKIKKGITSYTLTKEDKKLLVSEYNKYYYNNTTIDKRNKIRDEKLIKVCPICNKTFKASNGNVVYCSPACKSIATKTINLNYRLNNKEHIKELRKKWALNNPDKMKAIAKKYHASEKFKLVLKRYHNSEKGKLAVKRSYENKRLDK